jgi:hypothetical protein
MKEKLESFLSLSVAPDEEDIIFIQGSKGPDIIWIDKMEVQSHKIYFNARELRKELQN